MTPPPRTAWLVHLFFGTGPSPTGVLMESLAVGLQDAGYAVEVVTGRSGYNAGGGSRATRFAGPVRRLFSGRAGAAGTLGRLASWVGFYLAAAGFAFTRRLPDRVVLMTTPPLLHAAFVLRRLVTRSRCEVVLWVQDTYPDVLDSTGVVRRGSWLYRLMDALERWATPRLARVVALDGAMAARLRPRRPADVRVIPNWHSDADPPAPADDELAGLVRAARRRFRYVVLYTGNYGWGHDLSPLLAWVRANPGQTAFYFLFVGGGVKWGELAALEAEVGSGRAAARPYVSRGRVAALIADADFGLVCLEPACAGLMSPSKIHGYLAAGRPLLYLGPPASNVAEAIDRFGCGARADPTPAATARLLAELAGPDTDHARLCARAAAAGRERYSEAAGVADLTNLLTELDADRAPAPRPIPEAVR